METALQALSKSQPASWPDAAPAIPERWVGRVFDRLAAMFGSKLADLFGGTPSDAVRAEWSEALADYHPTEIARGLAACRARKWAPTLGEFLQLCRPALDPEIAWLEAVEGLRQRDRGELGEWTHPAVYRAAVAMGYEVRAKAYRECAKAWAWQLAREFDKRVWDGIPPPMLRLAEAPAKGSPMPASVRARLVEMGAIRA